MNRPRRLEVLSAIVEDYVHSRDPVGSKALVERHRLGVSSATVRNDMAALEEEGLIQAPHASAGRIPTDKGYRLFVDQISSIKPLSPAEKKAIATFLDASEDLDEVMERTVRLLSQLTRQVAVVQYPTNEGDVLRHLDLVTLGGGTVLVVLITARGRVQQRVVTLGAEATEAHLERFRATLLDRARQQPLDSLASAVPSALGAMPPEQHGAFSELSQTVLALAGNTREERLVMAGTSYLAQATGDFPSSIAPILDVLEEQVVLLRLLGEIEDDPRGVGVRIGAENQQQPLDSTAVVATGYGQHKSSKLGVIGPTRLDYPGTMSSVRAVARYLSRILHE